MPQMTMPPNPFWCDDCNGKAAFMIPGCPIEHDADCPRANEDAMDVYWRAQEWCKQNAKAIP